jgi:hypothetical protein
MFSNVLKTYMFADECRLPPTRPLSGAPLMPLLVPCCYLQANSCHVPYRFAGAEEDEFNTGSHRRRQQQQHHTSYDTSRNYTYY